MTAMVCARGHATLLSLMAALCLAVMLALAPARADEAASYTGSAACTGCHKAEAALWKTSHHALAMQPATPATVRGDFADTTFVHGGVTTTFHRSGDSFRVRTEGPDGKPQDYAVAYTFGVDPLQQYLIAFPGGRLQALGIAWDSRPKEQGGQRWFHLYPDNPPPPGDPVHWTGRDQTWNYQCAACHSTNLQKGYDLATDSYRTSWTDVDVSCEACHGPGSRHVARAAHKPAAGDGRLGLTNWLRPAGNGRWEMDPQTGIARRSEKLVSTEIDTCAACHARRSVIAQTPPPGGPFLDSFLPALLEPGMYHADGQIDGEVFEYGSFLQSRMYQAGVTCSNCHEPHSAKLRAEGNGLCAQCHLPAKFDVPEHTHHQAGGTGAQCVNCHMPSKTYMVVHGRRDHSFRVPRPDLSAALDTPNTCTQCHKDRSADWAAKSIAGWFPNGRQTRPQYGTALQVGRSGGADAERQLDALILDTDQPPIARASALPLLPRYASSASGPAIAAAVADPDPLVRAAAARALGPAAPAVIVRSTLPLLRDPIRAVRTEAARALSGVDPQAIPADQRAALAAAEDELVTAELVNADRPETHLNLGLLDTRRAQPDGAEAEYNAALRLDPHFVPAMMNLADLDRMRGRDAQGEALLRKALAIEPNNADVTHSLGLVLIRQHNYADAMPLLRKAAELAPDNARYGYVYAIALNSTGSPQQARTLLERLHQQHPADPDVLVALVTTARSAGDLPAALTSARELAGLYPGNPQIRMLVLELEKQVGH
nr:tetratricopeptide repeat protein [uncultured Rhodopila sp.]